MGVTIDKIYYHKYRASTQRRVDGVRMTAIAAFARSSTRRRDDAIAAVVARSQGEPRGVTSPYGAEERPQERVAVNVDQHRRPRLLQAGHVARAVVDDALLR